LGIHWTLHRQRALAVMHGQMPSIVPDRQGPFLALKVRSAVSPLFASCHSVQGLDCPAIGSAVVVAGNSQKCKNKYSSLSLCSEGASHSLAVCILDLPVLDLTIVPGPDV
jgi:hypothetical protein